MLRVTVELVPGGVGEPVVIGTAIIANDLEQTMVNRRRGSYRFRIYGKRNRLMRVGTIRDYPRLSKNVWHLVARVLNEGGFK